MKKILIISFLMAAVSAGFSEEYTKDDIYKMQNYLDSILMETRFLPAETRTSIMLKVLEIKKILNNQNDTGIKRMFGEEEFKDLLQRIKDAWPYRDQKIFLARLSKTAVFTMTQVGDILTLLSFADDKKDAARILLPVVIDPENIDVLYKLFWTPDDKKYINDIIDGTGK
ncbi:MAG: DUF4476 domain-containing protein [Spirochaetales bacterium]|nr:DUF4476 domain-containing protein [Spirochaetales bacterium]